ncbi:MAG: hypothetical protein O3B13_25955 [Planctomycetota bacterium]|nr:hypothetical protein [Planctomycetota bacterium]MDA1166555.1 hypothetical protein [Planctomycetota bacterium]
MPVLDAFWSRATGDTQRSGRPAARRGGTRCEGLRGLMLWNSLLRIAV